MVMHHAIDELTRGRFALCNRCNSRPCVDGCPGPAPRELEPEAEILTLRTKPKSGKAHPFEIWDVYIEQFQLSINESGVLCYLVRKTFGHGLYEGNYVSIAHIARKLRISNSTTMRALNVLESHGLIRRDRQLVSGEHYFEATFIGVLLPGVWPVPAEK